MAHRGLIRDAPQVWPPISLNDSCHAGPWIRRRCRAPNDSGSRTTSTLSYDVGRRKISYKDEFNEKLVKIYRYQNFTNLKRQKTFSMTSTLCWTKKLKFDLFKLFEQIKNRSCYFCWMFHWWKEWKSDQKTCKQTKDNNKTETATYERLKSHEMCVEILKRDISVHPSYVGFVCFMIKKNWRNSHNFFSINVSSCRRSQSETIFFLSNPYNYLTLL